MKLKLLLLSLLLSSCGEDICEGSDEETSQGICVFTRGFDVDMDKVNLAIDATEDVVSSRHPNRFKKSRLNDPYEDTSISFHDELGEDRAGDTTYEFCLFDGTYKIRVENEECLQYSWIIPHEMLHVYLLDINGDDTHKKGWFWHEKFTNEENASSIQMEIYSKIRCEVCDCK